MSGRVWTSCDSSITYQLTAFLRKYTSIALNPAPRTVKAKKRFKLTGQVVGAPGGEIAVQELLKGKWKNLGIAKLKPDGRFAYSIKPRTAGLHRYRIFYPGDQAHRGCTKAVKVRVKAQRRR